MSIGRYFKPVPLTFKLSAPPVEFLASALEYQQKKFDTNLAAAEKLKNQYIEALPQDRARANAIQQDIASKIDNMVGAYDGDYSRVTKDLYKLNSEIERSLKPGGEGHAIAANYKAFMDQDKMEKERLAKGEITGAQYNLWKNYTFKNYTGATQDPETGTYSTLQPEPIAKFSDAEKLFQDVVKAIPTRKVLSSKPTGETDGRGNIIMREYMEEYRDPDQTAQAFVNAFSNNPELTAYVSQMAKFAGLDPQEYAMSVADEYLRYGIPSVTGILDQSEKFDLKEDRYQTHLWAMQRDAAKESMHYNYKVKYKLFEHSLDKEESGASDGVHILTTTTKYNKYRPVSAEVSFDITSPSSWLNYGNPQSVDALIKSGEVDPDLMKTIRTNNPNLSDRAIIQLYNDNLTAATKFGSEVYFHPFKASQTAEEEMKRIYPRAATLQVPLMEIDPATGQKRAIENAEERKTIIDGWKDQESGKFTAAALGKSSIQTGGIPYGTVVQSNGKYYVLSETDLRIRDMINDDSPDGTGHRAFSFIDQAGAVEGTPFQIVDVDESGKATTHVIAGTKEYEWNARAKRVIPRVRYYGTIPQGEGFVINREDPLVERDKETGQLRYLTPADIEARYVLPKSVRNSTMPINIRSKDKAGNTPYED